MPVLAMSAWSTNIEMSWMTTSPLSSVNVQIETVSQTQKKQWVIYADSGLIMSDAVGSTESRYGYDYLEVANWDNKKAQVFLEWEDEIYQKVKGKPEKRQIRVVKRYVSALKELNDNDWVWKKSTISFFEKYTQNAIEKFKGLGWEFENVYDIVEEKRKQVEEKRKQDIAKDIQEKLWSLQ